MKKIFAICVLSTFFTTNLFAQTNNQIQTTFNKIIQKSRISPNELGIIVMDKQNTIVDINATKTMVPASLTKIITGAAVLKKMPLNSKFETQLRSDALIENGELKGDLCIIGGGDPSFVSEKMWALVNDFTRNGITKVVGNIIVDSSRFDSELYDKGRDSVRVDRAYDAPVSASSMNWNSVNVYIRPGIKDKDLAVVTLDPYSEYLSLENRARTTTKPNVKNISVSRVKNGERDRIIVSGEISTNIKELVHYKSITNPDLWTGLHLKEFLKQRNISVSGLVVSAECKSTTVLSKIESKRLIEMVSDMLKYSNNYVSEMLAKNLATMSENFIKTNKNASMADGIELIKKYLDEIGLKREEYTLTNVSGLNRKNKFNSKQIALVLSNIKNDHLIFPEFIAGLPIAGIDGTLKDRLKNDEKYNAIRAKTGYLDGVVGLSGYIGRDGQSPLVFVFMYNGSADKGYDARVLFDEFSKVLLN